ncbi:pentapeptide repeat-containing protein [Nonomuraea sp. B5E05]|uniref:pentapeptide repeat-containing protein n=1 Tax=Nonomuraea sp. B5E05 TaxID=3153569 RepID=UPI003260518B
MELDKLVIEGEHLEGRKFHNGRWDHVAIGNSELVGCSFAGSHFVKSTALGFGVNATVYSHCDFDNTVWDNVYAGRAVFEYCSFENVRLENMLFDDAEMVGCSFSGVLSGVTFSAEASVAGGKVDRPGNAYRGNDFSRVTFRDVNFRGGIDLDLQRLPAHPHYILVRNAEGSIRRTVEVVREWPDVERKAARSFLGTFYAEAQRGQTDLYLDTTFLRSRLSEDRLSELIDSLLGGR